MFARRLAPVALSGVLAISTLLAACGGESNGNAEGESGRVSGNAEGESGGQRTLVVWDQLSVEFLDYSKTFEELDAAFMEANPDVKVEHTHFPLQNYETRLRAAMATQQGPDIFGVRTADVYRHALVPLDSRITPEQESSLRGFGAPAVRSVTDGKIYAVPWMFAGNYITYNRELFEKAGLNPDNPPVEWADFLSMCRTLRDAGMTAFPTGFKDGGYALFFTGDLGARLLSPEQHAANVRAELSWKSPEVIRTIESLLEMEQNGCFVEDSTTKVSTDTLPDFEAGNAALNYTFVFNISQLEKSLGEGNIGTMQFPRMPGQPYDWQISAVSPLLGFGITSWSEHQDDAWEYISFISQASSQALAYELTGTYPPNHAEVDIPELEGIDPLEVTVLQDFLREGNPDLMWPPGAAGGEAWNTVVKFLPLVIAGDLTIEEFTDRMEVARLQVKEGQ